MTGLSHSSAEEDVGDRLHAHCRVTELSKDLTQQLSVAAELRRNLAAEAALHTRNVSFVLVCHN